MVPAVLAGLACLDDHQGSAAHDCVHDQLTAEARLLRRASYNAAASRRLFAALMQPAGFMQWRMPAAAVIPRKDFRRSDHIGTPSVERPALANSGQRGQSSCASGTPTSRA